MIPVIAGIPLLGSIITTLFIKAFDYLVIKVGRRYAMTLLSLTICLALFAAFWTVINNILTGLDAAFPADMKGMIPMFFPSETDEILSAFLAIRTAAAIVVFNARYVKQFTQFGTV